MNDPVIYYFMICTEIKFENWMSFLKQWKTGYITQQ